MFEKNDKPFASAAIDAGFNCTHLNLFYMKLLPWTYRTAPGLEHLSRAHSKRAASTFQVRQWGFPDLQVVWGCLVVFSDWVRWLFGTWIPYVIGNEFIRDALEQDFVNESIPLFSSQV